jgi:diacylglycerol kinase (ATP)
LNVSGNSVQIIYNPHSGSYSLQRLERLRAAWRDAGFEPKNAECSPTTSFVPDSKATMICIAGGDGTARQALAKMHGIRDLPPVCIYPMGTVNLIALELGSPRDPRQFVRQSLATPRPAIRPVRLNDTAFIVCVSVGPDALAVAGVSEWLKSRIGRLAYGASLIKLLFKWQRPCLYVTGDNLEFACEAIYIANGRYFAGTWSFAPAARLDEPVLHVVALKQARRRDFVAFILAIVRGRVESLANVIYFTTKSVGVSGDFPFPIQADGDIVDRLPLKIRIDSDI